MKSIGNFISFSVVHIITDVFLKRLSLYVLGLLLFYSTAFGAEEATFLDLPRKINEGGVCITLDYSSEEVKGYKERLRTFFQRLSLIPLKILASILILKKLSQQ